VELSNVSIEIHCILQGFSRQLLRFIWSNSHGWQATVDTDQLTDQG